MKYCADSGWHPKTCDAYEDVIAHEYGHVFHHALPAHDWAMLQGKAGFRSVRAVSQYAKRNNNEAFAEAFSEYENWRRRGKNFTLSPGAEFLRGWLRDNNYGPTNE